MFETSFKVTKNYSEILVERDWLRNCGDLWIKLKTVIQQFYVPLNSNVIIKIGAGGWGPRAENLLRASHDFNLAPPKHDGFEQQGSHKTFCETLLNII